jgi:hypothetical protein
VTDRPLVTVCVPAYRSERFIARTLASIQAQTFRDLRIRIGLEPVSEGPSVDAIRPFLDDPRVELVVNDRHLGWDANIAALLERVDTPLLCVQPHDDVLRPTYLEELVRALDLRPDASVAYSDVLSMGASRGRRSVALPDDPHRSRRELGFFLAGAEGAPWRGVTRREVLGHRFPTNPHRGFAVETEWALHLVQRGVALRAAQPLYLKRQFDRTADSVSIGWRYRMTPDELGAALEHNRARLLGALGPEEPDGVPRALVQLAAEAAMLRRWQVIPGAPLPFGPLQLERARAVLTGTTADTFPEAPQVAAMVHVALSRHHAALGDREGSLDEARRAVERAPTDTEAVLRLAQLLLGAGATEDALALVLRVAPAASLDDGVLRLFDALMRSITQANAAAEPLSGATG